MLHNKYKKHRPPHLYKNDTFYFITGAVLNHHPLLFDDKRKRLFIEKLKKSLEYFNYLLYAWVVLDNHYHIIIKTFLGEKLPFFITKLHSSTSLELNKLDSTVGRRIFYQYWDYCLRSRQEDRYGDLCAHINYLHMNPIKHSCLKMNSDIDNVNTVLSQYHFSSFNSFLRKYGEVAMNDLRMRYPVKAGLVLDEF